MRLLFAPYVSDEEQKEIEKSYGKPSKEIARTLVLEEQLMWKIDLSKQADKFIRKGKINISSSQAKSINSDSSLST